jgi:hypothetical protein
MALAVSTPLFLALGNAFLLGTVVIIIYWLVKRLDRKTCEGCRC